LQATISICMKPLIQIEGFIFLIKKSELKNPKKIKLSTIKMRSLFVTILLIIHIWKIILNEHTSRNMYDNNPPSLHCCCFTSKILLNDFLIIFYTSSSYVDTYQSCLLIYVVVRRNEINFYDKWQTLNIFWVFLVQISYFLCGISVENP